MHPASCTNHHDVTNLVKHSMVKNTKTWIILKMEHNFLIKQKNASPVPQIAHFEILFFSRGEIPYQIIQEKPNLHHPLQNFFSFGPWLDTPKLETNPKFQLLGSSGAPLFQSLRIGPLDQKMTARMWKWGLPYVSWFQFLRDVFSQ